MGLKTFEDYYKRLQKMSRNLYLGGEKIDRTDERLEGGIKIIRETFDAAHDQEIEDLCSAKSHLTGEKVNRFCHIHQSAEDLMKKQQMTRVLCHRDYGLGRNIYLRIEGRVITVLPFLLITPIYCIRLFPSETF